jgi:RNA polymerase sigma factor (sigma-70 family)
MQERQSTILEEMAGGMRGAALAFAQRHARDADEAEDIVQDALAKLARSAACEKGCPNPKALLFTTVRNLAIDRARRAARRPKSTSLEAMLEDNSALEPICPEASPAEATFASWIGPELSAVLAGLREHHRAALLEEADCLGSPCPKDRNESGTDRRVLREARKQAVRAWRQLQLAASRPRLQGAA